MKTVRSGLQFFCALTMLCVEALAQTPAKPAPVAAPAGAPAPAPDRTTASFGDWVLRCERRTSNICELGQTFQRPNEAGPQAQIAVGRISPTDPMRVTVLLPNNVALQSAPKITLDGSSAPPITLSWVRCVPNGCFAMAVIVDEALRRLSQQKDGGRLEYRDGADRDIVVPISFRGFAEALEAFQRDSVK